MLHTIEDDTFVSYISVDYGYTFGLKKEELKKLIDGLTSKYERIISATGKS